MNDKKYTWHFVFPAQAYQQLFGNWVPASKDAMDELHIEAQLEKSDFAEANEVIEKIKRKL